MEDGRWKMEDGRWKMEDKKRKQSRFMNKFKFEKLIIWQDAMDYAEAVNEVSQGFPDKEKFNLTS